MSCTAETPPAPSPVGAAIPLPSLAVKAVGRITALQTDGDDALRLKALGLCVGRQVQLVQTGDPLIVRVLAARVGISARLAAAVLVDAL